MPRLLYFVCPAATPLLISSAATATVLACIDVVIVGVAAAVGAAGGSLIVDAAFAIRVFVAAGVVVHHIYLSKRELAHRVAFARLCEDEGVARLYLRHKLLPKVRVVDINVRRRLV